MSATGHSNCRRERDDYPTPAWCVDRLLEAVALPDGRWLEPAAGDGGIIDAVNAWRAVARKQPIAWEACDVNPAFQETLSRKSDRAIMGDFTTGIGDLADDYDVAITNPPFDLAEEFLRECRRRARIVALLLRTNFLGSEERHALFEHDFPDVNQLPNRPTFSIFEKWDPKKKRWTRTTSDSCEYAWLVWGPARRMEGTIRRLALTPLDVRTKAKALAPVIRVVGPDDPPATGSSALFGGSA